MKTVKHIIGSIIGTLGLLGVFICGGGETIAECALCGLLGLAMLMIGGGMVADWKDEDDEEDRADNEM